MSGVPLLELQPVIVPGKAKCYETLQFLCPRCRKTVISVDFWTRAATRLDVGELPDGRRDVRNIWKASGDSFYNMTLTPSVDHSGRCRHCPGFHGFITNGQVT